MCICAAALGLDILKVLPAAAGSKIYGVSEGGGPVERNPNPGGRGSEKKNFDPRYFGSICKFVFPAMAGRHFSANMDYQT